MSVEPEPTPVSTTYLEDQGPPHNHIRELAKLAHRDAMFFECLPVMLAVQGLAGIAAVVYLWPVVEPRAEYWIGTLVLAVLTQLALRWIGVTPRSQARRQVQFGLAGGLGAAVWAASPVALAAYGTTGGAIVAMTGVALAALSVIVTQATVPAFAYGFFGTLAVVGPAINLLSPGVALGSYAAPTFAGAIAGLGVVGVLVTTLQARRTRQFVDILFERDEHAGVIVTVLAELKRARTAAPHEPTVP